jgi:lipopolysaccharide transport system permease protein
MARPRGSDGAGMTSVADRWVENRAPTGWHKVDLRELWAYRELIAFLAIRDVKVRYKQAVLGMAWAVLQPLAGALVFTLVFDRIAKLPSDGIPYPVFAFVGVTVWTYFTASVQTAMSSLVGNVGLVTKVYFPRMAAPIAAVLPGLLDMGISLLILVVLMVVYGVTPGLALLALPLCVVVLVALAFGVGLILATLNVRYRDVKGVSSLLLQLWLFASPVAYASSVIRDRWELLYALNPMAGLIDAFRWSLLGAPAPGADALPSMAVLVVILVLGLAVFAREERRFADII